VTVMTTIMSLDDCSAGPGACHANCGTACDGNKFQMSYPNFPECGSHNCAANTNAPRSRFGCGQEGINVGNGCTGRILGPYLQDCGPPGGQLATFSYCHSQDHNKRGCLNSKSFAYLCNGCNPLTWGNITVNYVPN